jgi:hypothetical protein
MGQEGNWKGILAIVAKNNNLRQLPSTEVLAVVGLFNQMNKLANAGPIGISASTPNQPSLPEK